MSLLHIYIPLFQQLDKMHQSSHSFFNILVFIGEPFILSEMSVNIPQIFFQVSEFLGLKKQVK